MRSAWDESRDLAPAKLVHQVALDDHKVFFVRPLLLEHGWVQVVGPALSALLSDPPREILCDLGPVFGALLGDDSGQDGVFFLRPGHVCHSVTVAEFEPALVALDL